jgi:hypothetical protein
LSRIATQIVDDKTFVFLLATCLDFGRKMGTRWAQDYILGGRADIDDPDNIDHAEFAGLAAEKGEIEASGSKTLVKATNRAWRN